MTAKLQLPAAHIHDDRPCDLGEGAFWHPARKQFFWFDITRALLMTRRAEISAHGDAWEWQFDAPVSAAAWIDENTLLVAGQGALMRFDIETGRRETIASLDCKSGRLRSNDGRADPQGGFWIGTMGLAAEPRAGAIWRLYRGEMRCLFEGVTIPNAICFSPCGTFACFTDTPTRMIMRQDLDASGWPRGEPQEYLDLRGEGLNPDGAVMDEQGRLWVAQWGAGRVAAYDRNAAFIGAVPIGAPHASCPAFAGPGLSTLCITSARQGMDEASLAATPGAGATFAADLAELGICGQAEHRFIL